MRIWIFSSIDREDYLTEHIMGWNRRKITKMAGDLYKRYNRVIHAVLLHTTY